MIASKTYHGVGSGPTPTYQRRSPVNARTLTCAFATAERNKNAGEFKAYAGSMTYIPERLTSLRQEITDLRNMNATYSQRRAHSSIEQSASEVRAGRLLQIKQELSKMLSRPDEVPSVWWENARRAKSVS